VEDAFGHWLAGFADGEGCFTILCVNGTYVPSFQINLRADDAPILVEIHDTLGIGFLTTPRKTGGPNKQIAWMVSDRQGTAKLVEIFDKYPLRAKKRRDYEIWRKAVRERNRITQGSRKRGECRDWQPMKELKADLSAVKRMVTLGLHN
jgi:hypothetical protein